MFDDGRSKRVIFLAHCFLNQNSISDGTAARPAAFRDMLDLISRADVGIIGANRSPNCGVETTSDHNAEISGMGLFMEEIFKRLSEKDLSVPMIGVKADGDMLESIRRLL